MIPKIIHYCWFGGKKLPMDVVKCIESWKKICPDYKIVRWDESNFNVYENEFTKDAYENKAWAFVSDYARLKIIYDNGGIYLDTDVELVKKLDHLLSYSCYVGIQQSELLCATGLGFGAEKGNPIIKEMLEQYNDLKFNEENKEQIACPILNHEVLKRRGYVYSEEATIIDNVLVLPPKYLDPIAPGKGMKLLTCDETISIHHYSASWMNKKTVIRRRLIRKIGQKRINQIKGFFS